MGNRLSKIYTRTGDDGTTGMADGSRVSKADDLFSVMGDIDELNSHIGLVRAHFGNAIANSCLPERLQQQAATDFNQALVVIQHLLFNIGGELAMPEYEGINATHIDWLEQQIDAMNDHLPPLKDFILPTGSLLVSQLHVARTVCRRAERQAVVLQQQSPQAIRSTAVSLVNRLSDWLFVAARFCTDPKQVSEVLWDNQVLQNLPNQQN
ncbi:cob(I)yrinic acid a,c-diamide adenosyltransferase [Psychrobacter sp. TAE2020]|uniref:cob(I)yrinic acid a,c-diamide adenosyltransferase n=1 Tax=Psychrobacter sp. TAE2020 TaxID=2846762 RepID=UPI001C121676|nr:cob(I)yrinic acid a,c-diamide adenosyltransferase [Psychrobacter sp. TAE2020]MBU5615727.1 cob(I)yrinic acid a,c-diamide adenosyltransferase [Psychrobacter sp. TAE2020]